MNTLSDNLQSAAQLTPQERSKITLAGANVFKDELEKVTREKHLSNKKGGKYGHMADGLTANNKNVDGILDGKSTVGWSSKFHATNARRLNDGTKKYTADHFVTNVQNSEKVAEKVRDAEFEEYKEIMSKKGLI